jgi:hypothetical protein
MVLTRPRERNPGAATGRLRSVGRVAFGPTGVLFGGAPRRPRGHGLGLVSVWQVARRGEIARQLRIPELPKNG